MIQEFKGFAVKGNMVDMAVGVVIGGAIGTVVKSLVDDVITPPLGMLTEGLKFDQLGFALRGELGDPDAVVIRYGSFINALVSFLIIAMAILVVVKIMNRANLSRSLQSRQQRRNWLLIKSARTFPSFHGKGFLFCAC